MENIRQSIIDQFSKDEPTMNLYPMLKNCIILNKGDIHEMDHWFSGVISSLYYEPNKYALVFVGEQGIGKSWFFKHLLPQEDWHTDVRQPYAETPEIYNHLIVDMSFFARRIMKEIMSTDGYVINQRTNSTDKRLASVCYTSNIEHPELTGRRRTILFNIKSINLELFNKINKQKLWIEIYNRFV